MSTYSIIRFYREGENRVIKTGLTLEEAQAHCQDPATREEGAWFDGYDEEQPTISAYDAVVWDTLEEMTDPDR